MENKPIELGTVAILQVQRQPLKQNGSNGRVYVPEGIVRVVSLAITDRGVVGYTVSGDPIQDSHHADHPESRFRGENAISVGFLPHYESLRQEFGSHLVDGIAGENILVASELAPTMADLAGVLRFDNPDGSSIECSCLKAMAPCDEFSHFARRASTRLHAAVLKETLQFLDGGRRGFTLRLKKRGEAILSSGARLVLIPGG